MVSSRHDLGFIAGEIATTCCHSRVFPYIEAYKAASHKFKPMTQARKVTINISCGEEQDVIYDLTLDQARSLAYSLLSVTQQEMKSVEERKERKRKNPC